MSRHLSGGQGSKNSVCKGTKGGLSIGDDERGTVPAHAVVHVEDGRKRGCVGGPGASLRQAPLTIGTSGRHSLTCYAQELDLFVLSY